MAVTEVQTEQSQEAFDRFNDRSFFDQSETFLIRNWDLLPDGYGVIYQDRRFYIRSPDTEHGEPGFITKLYETITLDARSREQGFTWQRTLAGTEGRTITQVFAGRDGRLAGWCARYDIQGRLADVNDLSTEETRGTLSTVLGIAGFDEVGIAAEVMRNKRRNLIQQLGSFSVSRQQEGSFTVYAADLGEPRPDRLENDKGRDMTVVSRLVGKKFVKELEKRQKIIDNVGFMATPPVRRPVIKEPAEAGS